MDKNEVVEENDVVDGVDEKKVETPDKSEKKFSQAQLDEIVKNRLAKEKITFKGQKDSLEAEKVSLKESVDLYEAELKKLIAPQLENVPDEYKELVEKLPLLEQVSFIAKLSSGTQSKGEKKYIPQTPKGTEKKTVSQRPVGTII